MTFEIGELTDVEILTAITLDEIKIHLGLEIADNSENSYLTKILKGALDDAENYTKRKLIQRSITGLSKGYWTYKIPYFPFADVKVFYCGVGSTTWTEFQSSNIKLDLQGVYGVVEFVGNLPELNETLNDNIKITWKGGYDKTKMPNAIWQAILLMVRKRYDFKGDSPEKYPQASEKILNGYRVYEV